MAKSDRGGRRPAGVTLTQEAQGALPDTWLDKQAPPISNNGRFRGAEAAKGTGPYHVSDPGRTRLTQELEGGAVTEVGVSGTPDGALSESLSR